MTALTPAQRAKLPAIADDLDAAAAAMRAAADGKASLTDVCHALSDALGRTLAVVEDAPPAQVLETLFEPRAESL